MTCTCQSGIPRPRNGFSLVEMMIVLFIMALLAGAAMLALPSGNGDLRREAERFAAHAIAARNEAITTSSPVATVVGPAGYYFERRVDGRWAPLDARALSATDWNGGTTAVLAGDGSANRRVIFDPLGLASEDLRLTLSHGGHAMAITIGRGGDVAVTGP